MKNEIVLRRGFSKSQSSALTFALTEGSVGPGCDPQGQARITKATIAHLVNKGLAVEIEQKPNDDFWRGWIKLTDTGRIEAHHEYVITRGRAWTK